MPQFLRDPWERAKATLTSQRDAYAHGEDRPIGSYGVLTAVYGVVVTALGAIVRARRSPLPERLSAGDLALVTLATHKVSRRIAKDPVTSGLRAPFTRYEGLSGDAELAESPRGSGLRHAVGELVACPFCLAQWTATAFVFGLVLAPRGTRLVASVFAASAGSDALQYVYAGLQRLER